MLVSSKQFTRTRNQWVADISDFGPGFGFEPLNRPDNGCKGFRVESERTGAIVAFQLVQTHKDVEGDVTHWVFAPTPESARLVPQSKALVVTLFND